MEKVILELLCAAAVKQFFAWDPETDYWAIPKDEAAQLMEWRQVVEAYLNGVYYARS